MLEDTDELTGEGDFRDEKDGRAALQESVGGELEIDIGLAAAGDTTEEFSGARGGLEASKGGFLGGVKGNER